MTQIKLTRNTSGHNKDAVITVTPGAAHILIEGGYAETIASPKKGRGKGADTTTESKGGGDSDPKAAQTAG